MSPLRTTLTLLLPLLLLSAPGALAAGSQTARYTGGAFFSDGTGLDLDVSGGGFSFHAPAAATRVTIRIVDDNTDEVAFNACLNTGRYVGVCNVAAGDRYGDVTARHVFSSITFEPAGGIPAGTLLTVEPAALYVNTDGDVAVGTTGLVVVTFS